MWFMIYTEVIITALFVLLLVIRRDFVTLKTYRGTNNGGKDETNEGTKKYWYTYKVADDGRSIIMEYPDAMTDTQFVTYTSTWKANCNLEDVEIFDNLDLCKNRVDDINAMLRNGDMKLIKCKECSRYFLMTQSQMTHFISKGIPLPKRCIRCRAKKKLMNDQRMSMNDNNINNMPGVMSSAKMA